MSGKFSAIRERFRLVDEQFEETRRHVRILHEDAIARFALLQEGLGKRKRR